MRISWRCAHRECTRCRLVPARIDSGIERWCGRDTAIVTGGTGGIGAHLARWLAGNGISHLVLISRTGPTRETENLTRELGDQGVTAMVCACDVGDREALSVLLDQVRREYPPIRTVVHAAGVNPITPATELTLAELAAVNAKAVGAAHLHELLADDPLDAFVLFSSVAGIWGSSGQAAYSAANAYLDALAEQRHATGRPATAIAWGPWAGDGMVAALDADHALRRYGLNPLPPHTALTALHQALSSPQPTHIVADVDWDTFIPTYTLNHPRRLLDDIPHTPADTDTHTDTNTWIRHLATLTKTQRHHEVLTLVRTHTATALGHTDPDTIDIDKPFRDLGFDSLTAIQLRNQLATTTGLHLQPTLIFDHPNPHTLTQHLLIELEGNRDSGIADLMAEMDRLESGFTVLSVENPQRDRLLDRIQSLLRSAGRAERNADQDDISSVLESSSDDELFDFIESGL